VREGVAASGERRGARARGGTSACGAAHRDRAFVGGRQGQTRRRGDHRPPRRLRQLRTDALGSQESARAEETARFFSVECAAEKRKLDFTFIPC